MRTRVRSALTTGLVLTSGLVVVAAGVAPAGAAGGNEGGTVAAATSAPAAGTVALRTIASGGRAVARTGDILWVEDGAVTAFDASGTALGKVPGTGMTLGIAASQDESVLYAWSADYEDIMAIDPATRQITRRWESGHVPWDLVADDRYVLFSHGSSTAHVEALDLASGESTPLLTVPGPARLFLGGTTLVVRSPTTLATYRVDGASISPLATRSLAAQDVAVSPDGSQFLATVPSADGTSAQRLTSAELVTRQVVSGEWGVEALAWAPDGHTFAVGLQTQFDSDAVRVYSAASGALVSRSAWPAPNEHAASVWALTFSRSAPLLQGFGGDTASRFVTASTQPGFSASASLKRVQPKVYGKRLRATFTAPGCAPCAVRFTLKDAVAGSKTFTRTVNKTIDLSLAVKGNGTLTASIPASLRRRAVQRSVTYSVPLLMKLRMTGKYKKRNNVLVYSKRPTLRIAVGPARKVKVVETIQIRVNGRWKDTMAWTYRTNSKGVLTVRSREPRARDNTIRLKYTFYPDGKNEAAAVVSPKLRWV